MLLPLLAFTFAQTPSPVALRLTTQVGKTECPNVSALKANIERKLGYSPFGDASTTVYDVHATCVTDGCSATVNITRPFEEPRSRSLSAGADRCDALFESVASSLAQSIEYEREIARRLNSVEAPAPLDLVPTKPEPAPQPPEVKTEFRFRGTLTGGASLGLSQEITPQLGAALGIGWRQLSLSFEGRFDLRQTVLISGSTVQSSVVLATLLPCVHQWGFGACLAVSTAAVHVRGDVLLGQRDSAAIVLLGPRLTYEWMFSEHVGLHAHVSFQGAFSTLTVNTSETASWSTSRLTGDASGGFLVMW